VKRIHELHTPLEISISDTLPYNKIFCYIQKQLCNSNFLKKKQKQIQRKKERKKKNNSRIRFYYISYILLNTHFRCECEINVGLHGEVLMVIW